MIKANEALAITNANVKANEEARMATIHKFLDKECDSAIREAIEKRQYCTFVKIPSLLANDTAIITNLLLENGYKAQVRHGADPSVLIMWK